MRKQQTHEANQHQACANKRIRQHGLRLQPEHACKQPQSERAQSGHHEAAKAGQNARDIVCGVLRDI